MSKIALVLEDEVLIAISLEDALLNAGYAVAGPFTHCADALTWLEGNTPDVGLLDLQLADGPCIAVAEILTARRVPIVFFSGLGPGHAEARALFEGAPWFEKPANLEDVMRSITSLTNREQPPPSAA